MHLIMQMPDEGMVKVVFMADVMTGMKESVKKESE